MATSYFTHCLNERFEPHSAYQAAHAQHDRPLRRPTEALPGLRTLRRFQVGPQVESARDDADPFGVNLVSFLEQLRECARECDEARGASVYFLLDHSRHQFFHGRMN